MNPVGTPAWLEHCIPCSVLRGETDAERGIQNLNIRVRIWAQYLGCPSVALVSDLLPFSPGSQPADPGPRSGCGLPFSLQLWRAWTETERLGDQWEGAQGWGERAEPCFRVTGFPFNPWGLRRKGIWRKLEEDEASPLAGRAGKFHRWQHLWSSGNLGVPRWGLLLMWLGTCFLDFFC